jgi:hypothetical protein
MVSPLHILAGLAGFGVIGAVTHVNVVASGGYEAPAAPLIVSVAVLLAVGSLCVGKAWSAKQRVLAAFLAVFLGAGEAWALLRTAERTLAHRDQQAAPRRAAEVVRQKAEARVVAAEKAVAGASDTPRLQAALAAKAAADATVREKAAEKGCAANCRLLLEQQSEAAAREVTAARAEADARQVRAEQELAVARSALAALPAPLRVNPLADTLHVEGWKIDLLEAVLASLALNGCGAALIAFAAHAPRRKVEDAETLPPAETPPERKPDPRDAAAEADWFARSTFRPGAGARVRLADLRQAYHAWCETRGLSPLPDHEIGQALSRLFEKVGLYREGAGAEAAIVGIAWKDTPEAPRLITSTAA